MTDQERKVMKMALEAMEWHVSRTRPIEKTTEAMDAIRQALAQPEQEPEALINILRQTQREGWIYARELQAELKDCRNALVEANAKGNLAVVDAALAQPEPEVSYTDIQMAELIMSDCGHSSDYTPLLDRIAGRLATYRQALAQPEQPQTDIYRAARHAREVLDYVDRFLNMNEKIRYEFVKDAIADLDKALAQPEQFQLVCKKCGADRTKDDCKGERIKCGIMGEAQSAQPEQRENRMTDREAIQKALDTPHRRYSIKPHGNGYAIYRDRDLFHHGFNLGHLTEVTPETIELIENALNTTLAQPEQEPVAYADPLDLAKDGNWDTFICKHASENHEGSRFKIPLFTAPPSKPCEITDLLQQKFQSGNNVPVERVTITRSEYEATLRSKNNG